MIISSFRVYKYRNIEDSGEVRLLDNLTCIVGKNQAGKTALLRALHKFNPHDSESYDMRREWPRGQRRTRDDRQVVCEVLFTLEDEEIEHLAELTDGPMEARSVLISKNYSDEFEIQFPDCPDLFPDMLHPNDIDRICSELPDVPTEVGNEFAERAGECVDEVRRFAKEGRFSELTQLRTRHTEILNGSYTNGNPEPQHSHETQFVNQYGKKIQQIETRLKEETTIHERAHDYLIDRIPTFIYMDDYRRFQGRAKLEELQQKRDNANLTLTKEDETLLMILALSGLDLDELIKQGRSQDSAILHDRQLDLEDAAATLTSEVAGRWGQNEYRIQFRADGQTFFTDIEETNKHVGMIPLEEQSKGFQWFFSFDLHFMHDSDGSFEGCVLLLDEPGLHLHPGGQEDLLRRLDAYAEKNALIYTTHLPFLVDLREPGRIRVLSQTDGGATVSENLGDSQPEEKLTLQAAFGMKANQSYLVSEKNLLVEGADDYWVLSELSNLFERSGKKGIPDDVMITAAGSASDIVHTATFMIGQDLQVVSLFDSDDAGRREEEKLRTKWLTRYKDTKSTTLLLGDAVGEVGDFMIEDMFPESYYLGLVQDSHEQKLKSIGKKKSDLKVSGKGPILPRVAAACEQAEILFNKGSVAKLIRRDLVKMANIADLPKGTEEKAEKLFKALCDRFDTD